MKKSPLNGRPAGSSNKTRRGVLEICKKIGYDPLKNLIDLIPYLGKDRQASIHLELMTYIYAKKKEEETPTETPNPWRDKTADELIGAIPVTNAGSNK